MNTCETCWAVELATILRRAFHSSFWLDVGPRLDNFIAEHTPRESEASGRADQGVAATAPRSASTESPPSADATAGPYKVEQHSDGNWFVVGDPRVGAVAMADTFSEALRDCAIANAAYRAGRDSMREPTDAGKQLEKARGYLTRLVKHCGAKPLPNIMGLCTQVDNLLAWCPAREPTEAMIEAGAYAMRATVTGVRSTSKEDARTVWDAMWKARDA